MQKPKSTGLLQLLFQLSKAFSSDGCSAEWACRTGLQPLSDASLVETVAPWAGQWRDLLIVLEREQANAALLGLLEVLLVVLHREDWFNQITARLIFFSEVFLVASVQNADAGAANYEAKHAEGEDNGVWQREQY